MKHYSYFNKYIINPIKRYGYIGDGRVALLTMKRVLGECMLRRTKKMKAKDLKLPPLTSNVTMLELDTYERDFYECIYKSTRSKFDTYVKKGTVLHNYAHIFELLARLRQAVNHPYLVIHGSSADEDIPSRSVGNLADVCGICHDKVTNPAQCAVAACRHTFHKGCMMRLQKAHEAKDTDDPALCPVCFQDLQVALDIRGLESDDADKNSGSKRPLCIVCVARPRDAVLLDCGHMHTCIDCIKKLEKKQCPICRQKIKRWFKCSTSGKVDKGRPSGSDKALKFGRNSILQKIDLTEFAPSTKTKAVISGLIEMRRSNKKSKAIIFSQYVNMLDLIEWSIHKANKGIRALKLTGSMPVNQRRSVLKTFQTDPNVHVILLSLKAGGEGLNLQAADNVFILDPWWNPAVEDQAIQRAHRIGQSKAVNANRFITKDTIEERMLQLQEKKQLVFEGTIDGQVSSLTQLTEEDLRFLFKN